MTKGTYDCHDGRRGRADLSQSWPAAKFDDHAEPYVGRVVASTLLLSYAGGLEGASCSS
jgi:hypothetical protein